MLEQLFNKYGCDKASKHGYDKVYEPVFEPLREQPINILEVGVFKGASVQAWLDYFPNATIYGIDVFTRVNPKQVDVLQHPRVKWIKGDSTDISTTSKIIMSWGGDTQFDIIIDDGLHTPRANGKTLTLLWPFLSSTGSYFIEDVWPLDIMTMDQMRHPWIQRNKEDYSILDFEFFLKQLEGKVVETFDLRKQSGEPDSFIYKVTHNV